MEDFYDQSKNHIRVLAGKTDRHPMKAFCHDKNSYSILSARSQSAEKSYSQKPDANVKSGSKVYLRKSLMTLESEVKTYPQESEMTLDFIPGQRGKSLLYFNGFTFAKNNECGGTVYWCCRSRKIGKPACRARITTSEQENGTYRVVVTTPHHNHSPSVRMLKKIEKCIKPE